MFFAVCRIFDLKKAFDDSIWYKTTDKEIWFINFFGNLGFHF